MDTPPKEEPKREKGSLVTRALQLKRDPSPTPSSKKELPVANQKTSEQNITQKEPRRITNSVPTPLPTKQIDHKEKQDPKNKLPQFTLTEMISTQHPLQQETEERNARSKDKRSKNTFSSRSLSPAKKEKNIQDKLSSSDPGKNIFRKSPRDQSSKNKPSKKTISPQKSPKNTQKPIDFKSALDAIHHEKTNLIKDFLTNFENNPNQTDSGELTLLHHAVFTAMAKNNASLVIPFLLEPRINSLIKNKAGYAPYQIIINDDRTKYQQLFDALLLRARLDRIVHAMIIMDEHLINKQCNDDTVLSKIKILLSRIPRKILPSYADGLFILAMIRGRLKYDLPIIKIVHDHFITNPNHQDEWGYTMLHHAACLRDKAKVKKLVKNPFITSKRNNEGFFPQGIIEHLVQNPEEPTDPLVKYTEKIRVMLFSRNSMDSWIEKELDGLLLINPLVEQYTLKPEDECVLDIKKQMVEYFENIARSQLGDTDKANDRMLPKENAQLPAYADDKFLLALLLTHMKDKKTKNDTEIKGFNPNPVFTESSESQKDEKEHTSSNIDTQLSIVTNTMMAEIESGAIKPIGSDSSLVALDSSSSSPLIPARDHK